MPVEYQCSFCAKNREQVHHLVAGPAGVYICNECVDLCRQIMAEKVPGDVYRPAAEISESNTQAEDPANIGTDHAKTNNARAAPVHVADERPMLEAWLEYHRATLAIKCERLSAEQLRLRAVPPSTLSLLGLVRHMAEVERGWFRRTLAGEDAARIYSEGVESDDSDLDVDGADVVEAFAHWQEECERARAIVARTPSLDVTGRQRHGNIVSLRWIMVHMIEEYARHNGHADLIRQRIDGAVGL